MYQAIKHSIVTVLGWEASEENTCDIRMRSEFIRDKILENDFEANRLAKYRMKSSITQNKLTPFSI